MSVSNFQILFIDFEVPHHYYYSVFKNSTVFIPLVLPLKIAMDLVGLVILHTCISAASVGAAAHEHYGCLRRAKLQIGVGLLVGPRLVGHRLTGGSTSVIARA